jgi:hypothetical protein
MHILIQRLPEEMTSFWKPEEMVMELEDISTVEVVHHPAANDPLVRIGMQNGDHCLAVGRPRDFLPQPPSKLLSESSSEAPSENPSV